MRDDLAALVARARNGDEQAWDELVDRYAPLIWSICRRYRLGRADSEDVGQSVWMRLAGQLASLRDPAALPGWLATTTQRECGRVLRAARNQEALRHSPEIPDTMTDAAESGLLRAERYAALREAFTRLPRWLSAAHRLAHEGPSDAVRRDQRQAGHPGREHRTEPQPLSGQAAP